MRNNLIKYNLQFFGEEENEGSDTDTSGSDTDSTDTGENGVDVSAFAELISEKDKVIAEQQDMINKLKKTNADLTLKISAGTKTEATFDDNLLGLVGIKH